MRTPASVVAGVDFGDPVFAHEVRDGVARIEDLMSTELAHRISDAGWSAVRWRNLTGGIVALHAATKPLS